MTMPDSSKQEMKEEKQRPLEAARSAFEWFQWGAAAEFADNEADDEKNLISAMIYYQKAFDATESVSTQDTTLRMFAADKLGDFYAKKEEKVLSKTETRASFFYREAEECGSEVAAIKRKEWEETAPARLVLRPSRKQNTIEENQAECIQRNYYIDVTACALTNLAAIGVLPTKLADVTPFHQKVELNIHGYFQRICKYSPCSAVVMLSVLALFNRLLSPRQIKRDGRMITVAPALKGIDCINIHLLVLTSILVISKFQDDAYYSNAEYAKIGDLSVKQMNRLELALLNLSDFGLFSKRVELLVLEKELQSPQLHGQCKCLQQPCPCLSEEHRLDDK